jgi:glycosyltransferase involved in cell wall biosynthesis
MANGEVQLDTRLIIFLARETLQDEYKRECYDLAENLSNVKFLGFVNSKAERLKKGSIFVMPSEYETGIESINEAMACGCKILRIEGGGADEFLDKKDFPEVLTLHFYRPRF